MKSTIFIPKKCKVGFNLRQDTYTGKLGYIIYHDGKVWRKENSWESWRQKPGDKYLIGYEKDENGKYPVDVNGRTIYNSIYGVYGEDLAHIEFENVPLEGFVLNKKAGGYSSGWNHRQTYCRVYDPRGFEFEITIQNLLYILENSNSIKGKGLEGKFIYGWDGKDLVLIPEESPEYKEMLDFSSLQNLSLKKSDLILGGKYKLSNGQTVTYLDYSEVINSLGLPEDKKSIWIYNSESYYKFETCNVNRFKKFIGMDESYAGLMEQLSVRPSYLKREPDLYQITSEDQLHSILSNARDTYGWNRDSYSKVTFYFLIKNKYKVYQLRYNNSRTEIQVNPYRDNFEIEKYSLTDLLKKYSIWAPKTTK